MLIRETRPASSLDLARQFYPYRARPDDYQMVGFVHLAGDLGQARGEFGGAIAGRLERRGIARTGRYHHRIGLDPVPVFQCHTVRVDRLGPTMDDPASDEQAIIGNDDFGNSARDRLPRGSPRRCGRRLARLDQGDVGIGIQQPRQVDPA